jgi:hypothetical protein
MRASTYVGPLSDFNRWYRAGAGVWRTVRVAGVALHTADGWTARRVLVSLEGPLYEEKRLQTAHVLFFDKHLAASELPRLLLELAHGRVPEHVAGVPDVRLFSGRAVGISGDEHLATTGTLASAIGRLPRFELRFHSGTNAGSPFTYELGKHSDRELRSHGRRGVAELAAALGIIENVDELRFGTFDERVCRVVAALPARIAAVQQSADRALACVRTEVRPDLIGRVRILLTRVASGWNDPISRPANTSELIAFDLPANDDVEFTLLFDERPVQVVPMERLPLLRRRIRERAVTLFEGASQSLIASGLEQAVGSHNANAFERAVTHLFGVIGFSGFWWGPNRTTQQTRMQMPAGTSDGLLFSSDDAVVAVMECTLDAPGRDKALKLVQRAKDLQRELRAVFNESLRVEPVLVVARSDDSISEAVRELCTTDGLVLISSDTLRALWELASLGASDSEIRDALPRQLRAGLASDRLFSRFF